MSDVSSLFFFFFNDTATTEIYTLSLHDALPIYFGDAVVGAQLDALVFHLGAGGAAVRHRHAGHHGAAAHQGDAARQGGAQGRDGEHGAGGAGPTELHRGISCSPSNWASDRKSVV